MKRLLILFFIATNLVAFTSTAAELRPDCNKKGKWGYVDENGHIVVDYKFNGASEFNDGVAHVLSGKKYGVIDTQGKYVIKPDYDVIAPFNQYGLAQVTKGNKSGFINRDGKAIIDIKYNFTGDFNSDGVVWVNEGGKVRKGEQKVSGGKFFLLRADGSNFLDDSFSSLGFFIPYSYSYSQATQDKMTTTEKRLTEGNNYTHWRRINYSFIPGKPITLFNDGIWAADDENGYYNGVYTKDGKTVIPAGKYYVANKPSEGISVVWPTSSDANYLDIASGSLILADPLEESWSFKNGYAIGKFRGLRYIYDKNGRRCSEGYTYIYPANSGVHVVRNGKDKYGLISEAGEQIVAPNNYSVYPCIGGVSWVKPTSKSKAGYMGADGAWIIEPKYDNGYSLHKGLAIVSLDGKWGCVNKQGDELIPFEFTNIMPNSDKSGKYFWVKRSNDSKYELYSIPLSRCVIGPEYTQVEPFDKAAPGLAKVNQSKSPDSWGVIDVEGHTIIPFEFTSPLATAAAREYDDSGRGEWTPYRNLMFKLRHDPRPVALDAKAPEDKWDF